MSRLAALLAALLAPSTGFAQSSHPAIPPPPPPPPVPAYGTSAIGVLFGTDTSFQGGPASFRFTLTGEYDVIADSQFALSIAMPITIVTQGDESFGVSLRHTALELPPSLRMRLMPQGVVRLYGDVGLGMVVVISKTTESDWYLASDQQAGFMTRFGLGLEIGPPRGPMFLLEPIGTRTYWMGPTYGRVGFMAGFGGRF